MVVDRDLRTVSQGLQTDRFFMYILPLEVAKQQVSSYILA